MTKHALTERTAVRAMTVFSYPDFALELEDPVVVGQGGTYEDLGWGPWQFPSLCLTERGHVLCTWARGEATIEGYEDSIGGDLS